VNAASTSATTPFWQAPHRARAATTTITRQHTYNIAASATMTINNHHNNYNLDNNNDAMMTKMNIRISIDVKGSTTIMKGRQRSDLLLPLLTEGQFSFRLRRVRSRCTRTTSHHLLSHSKKSGFFWTRNRPDAL